jgi:hypothetical protein
LGTVKHPRAAAEGVVDGIRDEKLDKEINDEDEI